jgi:hypothetical protein
MPWDSTYGLPDINTSSNMKVWMLNIWTRKYPE